MSRHAPVFGVCSAARRVARSRDRRPDQACCHGCPRPSDSMFRRTEHMTIRNPVEWGTDQFRAGSRSVGSGGHAVYHKDEDHTSLVPAIRRINPSDLKEVLAKGLEDFGAYRTDVIFLCIIYPIIGIVLA